MTQCIIFRQPSGGVSVVYAAPNDRIVTTDKDENGLPVDETEAEQLARVALRAVPAGAEFAIVDAATLPTDRTKRNQWRWNAGSVEIGPDPPPVIRPPTPEQLKITELEAKLDNIVNLNSLRKV